MIEIEPIKEKLKIQTKVPSSKSYTNRGLIIATLAEGESEIINPLISDDTKVLIKALTQVGKEIQTKNNNLVIKSNGPIFSQSPTPIYLENAGTAVRFLTASLALQNHDYKIIGSERMHERPIQDLLTALKQLGAKAESVNNNDCPPLNIKGPLIGGTARVNGEISSQFLSALLMIMPLTIQKTTIKVEGRLTSLPYIDMTIDIMEKFGVKITNNNYSEFTSERLQYKATNYQVEGDASSATYPLAISAINNSNCIITNVPNTTKQADYKFKDILKLFGCKVDETEKGIEITGPKKLTPLGEIDLNKLPDASMTIAVMSAFATGKTVLTNIGNLRIKETDRLSALAKELSKIGADVTEGKDSLTINGNPNNLHGAEIETYNDHRIAMCFAVAGTKIKGIKIKNPSCTSKTYPDFWNDLKKWGINWIEK